jgi:hypothetical protein
VLSRRGFLLGSTAAAVLVACGDDGDDVDATGSDAGGTDGGTGTTAAGEAALVLGEAFDRNGLLVAGIPQRAPFLLFEESGGLVAVGDAPAEVTFTAAPEGGGDGVTAVVPRRGDDVDRAYYPLVATFPAPGRWSIEADLGDGRSLRSMVNVNADVPVAQVGDPLPVAPSPTTADPLGATNLCTQDPPCPFHEVSLADAVALGRPVAVLVSTPEYCQVGICGPVLGLLTDAAGSRPDLTVVHIEVYTEGGSGDTGPPSPLVVDTFQLSYEPVLFVADAAGTITARLDNIYDGPELAEALASGGA